MADFVSDTFTGGATTLETHTGEVGATWAKHPSYTGGGMQIDGSGRCTLQVASATHCYYASGVPAGTNYDITFDLTEGLNTKTNGTAQQGVAGRIDSGANTFYMTYRASNTGTWTMRKIVAGTQTVFGSYAEGALTGSQGSGDTGVVFQMRDSAKALVISGVTQITSADNAITAAGFAGLYAINGVGGTGTSSWRLDNLTVADVILNPPSTARLVYVPQAVQRSFNW